MIQANEAMQPGPPTGSPSTPPHPTAHRPQPQRPFSPLRSHHSPAGGCAAASGQGRCCWAVLGWKVLEAPPQDGAGQEGSGSPVGPTSQVQVLGSSQHLSSSGSSTRSDTNTTTSPSIYTPFSASKTGTSTAHDSATTTHVPQPA